PHDRVLQHSLTYALIEIGDPAATAKGLADASPHEKCAALVALDQMDSGTLEAPMVASLLSSTDPLLRQTASWVAAHHPDWGGALAGFFTRRLEAMPLSASEEQELQQQLARLASAQPI